MGSLQQDVKGERPIYRQPSLVQRFLNVWYMLLMKAISAPFLLYRDCIEWFNPPAGRPDIIESYPCRPHLPVRIFFPTSYDKTTNTALPVLFAIHGGGFCFGTGRDADEWARAFADQHMTMVVVPSYSKAPWSPFPAALHDVEAIYAAVLADSSLPIMRTGAMADGAARVAVLGWSAGGNLALGLSQLPSVRDSPHGAPAAAVTVYGALDMTTSAEQKARSRWYKAKLQPPRGQAEDGLLRLAPLCDWAYVPRGADLRHPLLSPAYADERDLPPYVCVVAAELDLLAHESWRFAVRIGNERFPGVRRDMPDVQSSDEELAVVGRKSPSRRRGRFEEEEGEEKFGWEENGDCMGVKWILVPDVLHGFDCASIRAMTGGWDAMKDGEMKTRVEIDRLGRWLRTKVWKLDEDVMDGRK